MKTGWFLGGALLALLMWTAACGSDGSGSGGSPDGGGQQGGDGGPGSKIDGGGGGNDAGSKGGADGGDGGSTAVGNVFGPPVMGDDNFGATVALSADGTTLAVGAETEASNATGINGDQNNTVGSGSGAVFVYATTSSGFALQAYVKASNTGLGAHFGHTVALSGDGNTMIVGAAAERSNATGVNGNQADTSMSGAGAAYVFVRTGATWSQQAYLKPSNTRVDGQFGRMVAMSSDGTTAVVGAPGESGGSSGIDGNQSIAVNASSAGAAYVFKRSGATWSQQAYVKSSNTLSNMLFGSSGALSSDGNVMVIGAPQEASKATGINGDQTDQSLTNAGAVYAFVRTGTVWAQQAYIKASNTKDEEKFGNSVSIAGDGNTLVVGAFGENSNATGINGNQADTSSFEGGAAFVFTRSGMTWSQQAFLKASDATADGQLGWSTAISATGDTLIAGAPGMNSQRGAAYLFTRSAGTWTQKPRLGPSLPASGTGDRFGYSLALSTTPAKTAVGLLGVGMVETF